MSGGPYNLADEVLKSLIGEAASALMFGLQTALRFAAIQTRDGDSTEDALRAALGYRFAPPPPVASGDDETVSGVPENDSRGLSWREKWKRRRQKRKAKKAEKRAREEGQKMADLQGLNVPALVAVSAEGGADAAQDLLPSQADPSVEGVLVPLQIVRSELAYARRPVVPPPPGWRHHVAEVLTAAAVAGLTSGNAEQRTRWEKLFQHALGISENFAARAPDWGRLVAAAFEYEMRRAENAKLGLSSQLDRADVALQVQDLAKTAGLAHRSLSRLVFFVGVMASAAVAAAVIYGISLLT